MLDDQRPTLPIDEEMSERVLQEEQRALEILASLRTQRPTVPVTRSAKKRRAERRRKAAETESTHS